MNAAHRRFCNSPTRTACLGRRGLNLALSVPAWWVTGYDSLRMPPGGFLPDSWRDLIAITSLIGTLGTLAALVFAVVQVRRTRRIAQVTQDTMDTVLAQARSAVSQYAMSTGRRQLSEAKLFFDTKNWSAAALRMGDLAEQAAQLAQSFSSDRQNWKDLGSMFRNWEATCRRLDRGTMQPIRI